MKLMRSLNRNEGVKGKAEQTNFYNENEHIAKIKILMGHKRVQ